jgi:L-fuconolactonase
MLKRTWQSAMINLARSPVARRFMQANRATSYLASKYAAGQTAAQGVKVAEELLSSFNVRSSLFYLGEYVSRVDLVAENVANELAVARARGERLDVHVSVDPTHRGASPMMIIDSQVHAYEANTPKRPWHSVPNWPDHVTGDEMVAAMDKVGVDGAIFISSFSMYRYDGSYAVAVQRAHPGRFAIVKPVDPDDPSVADVIAEWKRTPGAVGVRIFLPKEAGRDPNDPGFGRILRAASRHDFPVNILCWGNLEAGTALIDRHPDTRFIIDHLGILQPRVPPAPPQPWADLPKVLELARRPNAVIKVSGACTLSREPYPFPDIWEPLARVFDAWGFERCLWGTDWTRAFAVVNYEQAVKPFLDTDRLSGTERAMLMGGACAKAYGWRPRA